jgi:hypothetical protein
MYKEPEENLVFLLATTLPHPLQGRHYSINGHKRIIDLGNFYNCGDCFILTKGKEVWPHFSESRPN